MSILHKLLKTLSPYDKSLVQETLCACVPKLNKAFTAYLIELNTFKVSGDSQGNYS